MLLSQFYFKFIFSCNKHLSCTYSYMLLFPIFPEAWKSFGIRVEGCLLTCEGAEACEVCKDEPNEHHGARYLTPFSKEHPHFEVLHFK